MYINQFILVFFLTSALRVSHFTGCTFVRQFPVLHFPPPANLSVIFQSCNFHPLKFLCPSFSCPANSSPPSMHSSLWQHASTDNCVFSIRRLQNDFDNMQLIIIPHSLQAVTIAQFIHRLHFMSKQRNNPSAVQT